MVYFLSPFIDHENPQGELGGFPRIAWDLRISLRRPLGLFRNL
jgi:hypothetical protein